MANHTSSKKRIRSNKTKRETNRYHGKTVRNALKEVHTNENKEEASKALPEVISKLDKLAKKGIIHKNKAANLKSKLMKQIKVEKTEK